jgi:RNA polymerase sigma-70 factor (ECF subfamily)
MSYCLLSSRGDRELALDLSQEAFTRAFRGLPTLADPGNFRGWLFTIVANLCRTRGAAEGRRRALLESFAVEQQAQLAPEDPETRERRIATVREFLAQVDDPSLRQIVQLHYVEAVATREIARRLSIPHGTVTVKLMRFRAAVKRDLSKALAEEAT